MQTYILRKDGRCSVYVYFRYMIIFAYVWNHIEMSWYCFEFMSYSIQHVLDIYLRFFNP